MNKDNKAQSCAEYGKYENALLFVYRNNGLKLGMHIVSYVVSAITVIAFALRLIASVVDSEWLNLFKILVITGVPFVLVSALRHLADFPRPYEVYSFYEIKPKRKIGKSFPSRHLFSIFVIGVVLLEWNVFIGMTIILLGLILAPVRVLLGIHFVRDVVAGALIGAVSGVIGLLILNFV